MIVPDATLFEERVDRRDERRLGLTVRSETEATEQPGRDFFFENRLEVGKRRREGELRGERSQRVGEPHEVAEDSARLPPVGIEAVRSKYAAANSKSYDGRKRYGP